MKHRSTQAVALAAAIGLGAALSAAPAFAQDYQQDTSPQASAPDVSSEKLDKFVDALAEISVIREAAAVELEAAEDMEQAQKLQQEAQAEMIDAVETAGLTVEEYNQIATVMGSDPELAERVRTQLEERS
ncbi:DUF4168 domain-containing protein [Wenzhouxiangella sp. XN24]|uniref:DUF4168 domain-containing protein n=1 Tax=Wenzhouxiangella sp. XN24 TaxID=2713569 RepID=UPI0013EA552F|nr:DUF4168 domain-containing protein [Wenzhouxiangella sp. XN24]NGX17045.1 DUF4168 domain-containing protein [Wenzhouxiangella sp. XN24]